MKNWLLAPFLLVVIFAGASCGGESDSDLPLAAVHVVRSPITSGELLEFQLIGFTPGAEVRILVEGGGGLVQQVDDSGAGDFSFVNNDPPGAYVLSAEDDDGHAASDVFEISPATVALLMPAVNKIMNGDNLDFSFTGFSQGARVQVSLDDGDGVSVTADETGSGAFSLPISASPGLHTLVGIDDSGKRATVEIEVTTGSTASLTLTDSVITSGDVFEYTFAGFQPGAAVRIVVRGGGGLVNVANAQGTGTFSFVNDDPVGSYVLTAEDDFGNVAQVAFEIELPPATLVVLNAPVVSGTSMAFAYSGFEPNEDVTIFVQGGGGLVHEADSVGAGQFAFVNGDPPGEYELVAEDAFGNSARIEFTVIAP